MEHSKSRKLKSVALLTLAAVAGSAAPAWADIDPNEGAFVAGTCWMDPICEKDREFIRNVGRIVKKVEKVETTLDALQGTFSETHERAGRSAADSLTLYYKVEINGAKAVLNIDVISRGEYWDDIHPGHFVLTVTDDTMKDSRRFVYSGEGAIVVVVDGAPVSVTFGEYSFTVGVRPSRESVRRIEIEEEDIARDRREISRLSKEAKEANERVAGKIADEEATAKAKKRSRFMTWILGAP